MKQSAPLDAVELRPHGRRRQRGAAVGAVDVEPQVAAVAHVGDAGEVVDDAEVGGAGGGDHGEHAVAAVRSRARASSAAPVSRPRSSARPAATSTSITWAAETIEECASSVRRDPQPCRPRAAALGHDTAWRAATSAERLPTVPPCTKQPPALSGSPARSAIQRSAWFSAYTAPAPSSQLPP